MAVTARSSVLFTVRGIQRLIDLVLTVGIVAALGLFGLQFPHSPRLDGLWLITQLRHYGDAALAGVGSWLDLTWPASSTSFLPLGIAFAIWMGKIMVDAILLRSHRALGKLMPAPQLAAAGDIGSLGVVGLEEGISADSARARDELLKKYREIEQALKGSKRKRCAFLSIDIVGSTQMKVGERETEIAATFHAYEETLKKIFEQYGAWKQAWTPDGVMICFLQLDLAVGAAQRVLQGLKKFNESDNKLRTPFRVRCGLNEGEVPIFEDSKLEKVADRVIDVAGHMQKQGAPGTLWLSAEIYNQLGDKTGFRPTGQEVDGFQAYEWVAEPSETAAKAAS